MKNKPHEFKPELIFNYTHLQACLEASLQLGRNANGGMSHTMASPLVATEQFSSLEKDFKMQRVSLGKGM